LTVKRNKSDRMVNIDTICCEALDERDSASDGSITCRSEGILECDYDTQCTKLYKLVEDKQWEEVLYFLETGKFYDTNIFTTICGREPDPPSLQAMTWVTALDESGNVRWCQLPLHAAVTFCAPFSVIEMLVRIYPRSVRCADDQDMLPLHYGFRFGADDDVVAFLLEKFPQAIGKKAVKDRRPLDMAQYGPKAERGIIIDYYVENAVRSAKADWDGEYEKIVSEMKTEADFSLKKELAIKKKKLRDKEKELSKALKEIEVLREKLEVEESKNVTTDDNGVNPSKRANSKSSKGGSALRKKKIANYDTADNAPTEPPRVISTGGESARVSKLRALGKVFGKRRKHHI